MRLFFLITLFSVCVQSTTVRDSWFGFCIVEIQGERICNEANPRTSDFSLICDAFARHLGAHAWRAQFANSLSYLRELMPNYCDSIQDGSDSNFYACKIKTYCPHNSDTQESHLASRVYAQDEADAITRCLEKETAQYHRKIVEQSQQGCFAQITTEQLTKNQ